MLNKHLHDRIMSCSLLKYASKSFQNLTRVFAALHSGKNILLMIYWKIIIRTDILKKILLKIVPDGL